MKKLSFLSLCIVYMLLSGSFSSCASKIEDKNPPVYVWPKGPKYYYSFNEKIFLFEVDNKIVLSFDEKYLSDIQQYLEGKPQIQNTEFHIENHYCILTTVENTDVKALMKDLKKQTTGVKSVNPMYTIAGGLEMGVTDLIVVQFKKNVTQQEIDKIQEKYHAEVKEINQLFLLLSVPIDFDPLEVANAIQESGLTNYSNPNFIAKKEYW